MCGRPRSLHHRAPQQPAAAGNAGVRRPWRHLARSRATARHRSKGKTSGSSVCCAHMRARLDRFDIMDMSLAISHRIVVLAAVLAAFATGGASAAIVASMDDPAPRLSGATTTAPATGITFNSTAAAPAPYPPPGDTTTATGAVTFDSTATLPALPGRGSQATTSAGGTLNRAPQKRTRD
jgi:hypothetical protein